MKDLKVEATKYTPAVWFESQRDLLCIKGETYPENTMEFYAPIFEWLRDYFAQSADRKLTVDIELTYFNSSSSKGLINLFDLLGEEVKAGRNICVNWIYEKGDDDNLEFGEEFAEDLSNLEFNLVQKDH